jgi:hypothetical protein
VSVQNGGIQLDKEVRLLVSSMTGATEWTVRDKFTRLTQMATLLSLERVCHVMTPPPGRRALYVDVRAGLHACSSTTCTSTGTAAC